MFIFMKIALHFERFFQKLCYFWISILSLIGIHFFSIRKIRMILPSLLYCTVCVFYLKRNSSTIFKNFKNPWNCCISNTREFFIIFYWTLKIMFFPFCTLFFRVYKLHFLWYFCTAKLFVWGIAWNKSTRMKKNEQCLI